MQVAPGFHCDCQVDSLNNIYIYTNIKGAIRRIWTVRTPKSNVSDLSNDVRFAFSANNIYIYTNIKGARVTDPKDLDRTDP
jgi:hypothetical protein